MTVSETAFKEVFDEKEKKRADRLVKAKKIITAYSNNNTAESVLFTIEAGHFLRMKATSTHNCTVTELFQILDRVADKRHDASVSISHNPDGTFTVTKVRLFKL